MRSSHTAELRWETARKGNCGELVEQERELAQHTLANCSPANGEKLAWLWGQTTFWITDVNELPCANAKTCARAKGWRDENRRSRRLPAP